MNKIPFYLLLLWILISIFAGVLTGEGGLLPYDHFFHDHSATAAPPFSMGENGIHILGTDPLGRDLLSLLVAGSQVALITGFGAVAASHIIGFFFGWWATTIGTRPEQNKWWGYLLLIISLFLFFYFLLIPVNVFIILLLLFWILFLIWYFLPHRMGNIAWGFVEIFRIIPELLIIIVIAGVISDLTYLETGLLIGLLKWPAVAVYVRGEWFSLRERPFIINAKMSRIKKSIFFRDYILRNLVKPISVITAFIFSGAILIEASLSFLGLLPIDDFISWGSLLSEGKNYPQLWWLSVFPGLILFLITWLIFQWAYRYKAERPAIL